MLVEFEGVHKQLRDSLEKYLDTKVVEVHERWSKADSADEGELRRIFREMGSYGWIMPWASEEFGGCEADLLSSCIIANSIGKKGLTGISVWLHGDTASPILALHGTQAQKERYLAPAIRGEKIVCIAMTEPDTGSDLLSMKTTARRDGGDYLINGNKCFITNGSIADIMLVACRMPDQEQGKPKISLFIVDAHAPGVTRRKIRKVGSNVGDTGELFFDDVRVPAENMLGEEGRAYGMLMEGLQHERLVAAANYLGVAERGFDLTVKYVTEREVFGRRVADFQNTSFALADLYTRLLAGSALVKELAEKVDKAEDDSVYAADACAAKSYCATLAQDCLREGVQLHGAYGISSEYEIGRLNAEAMSFSLAAGTTEIMKLVIGRKVIPRKWR